MKTSRLFLISFLGLSAFTGFACGDGGSEGGAGDGDGDGDGMGGEDGDAQGDGDGDGDQNNECDPGSEGCECYGNGTCDGDLSCLSNRCVDAGSTGDGDGDGDGDMGGASGDGDGDVTGTGGSSDLECSRNSECDDEDECTEDVCTDGMCEHTSPESPLCQDGKCLAVALDGQSTQTCHEAVSEKGLQLCDTTKCGAGDVAGCNVDIRLGTPTVSTSETTEGGRSVAYAIPVLTFEMSGDVVYGEIACAVATEVVAEKEPVVTVTLETSDSLMCGAEETVRAVNVDVDLDPLVFRLTPPQADEGECARLETALTAVNQPDVAAFRAPFEAHVLEALGDLNQLVTVGTICASCDGDCEGLTCGAPAPLEK